MDCIEVEAHLPLFCGGDLEAPLAERVGAHLSDCEVCGARLEAALRARSALLGLAGTAGLAPRAFAPDTFGPDPLGVAPVAAEVDLWPGVRAGLVDAGLIVGAGSDLDRDGLVGSPARPFDRPAAAPRGRLFSWPRLAGSAAAAALFAFLSMRALGPVGPAGPAGWPTEGASEIVGAPVPVSVAHVAADPGPLTPPPGLVRPAAATGGELAVPLLRIDSATTPWLVSETIQPSGGGGLRPLAPGDELLRERALFILDGPAVHRPVRSRGQGAGWSLASDGVLEWR